MPGCNTHVNIQYELSQQFHPGSSQRVARPSWRPHWNGNLVFSWCTKYNTGFTREAYYWEIPTVIVLKELVVHLLDTDGKRLNFSSYMCCTSIYIYQIKDYTRLSLYIINPISWLGTVTATASSDCHSQYRDVGVLCE